MADENKKEETTAEPEEKKEKEFSKRVTQLIALSALVLAICATFSSLKAGAFSSKAILAQNAASNGWAYYQSKSLKENTYKVQLDQMRLNGALDPADRFDDGKYDLLIQSPAVKEFLFGADDSAVSGNKEDVVCDRTKEVQHAGVLPAAAGAEADADFLQVFDDLEVLGVDLVRTFFDECTVDVAGY